MDLLLDLLYSTMDALAVRFEIEAKQSLELFTSMAMGEQQKIDGSTVLEGRMPGGFLVCEECAQGLGSVIGLFS